MVGMICGCCNQPDPPDPPNDPITFCLGKQSTTGTLTDNFAPTPFANYPLPPGDFGPGTFNGQTYEGWRGWVSNARNFGGGAQRMPWKRIPTNQRFHGLETSPPIPGSTQPVYQFYRSTSNRQEDAFLYSIDILQAKYYTQIDVNLDFQYAPLLNGPIFQGLVLATRSAYHSPSYSFGGIFFQEQEHQATGPMGPILTVFMRKATFNNAGGQGPWGHYWYITDRTSPTSTAALKQVNLLNDPQPIKRLGCLAECVNVQDYNTANRPVIRYTLDIDGVVIYTNTYNLRDSQHINGWRLGGYCRCILAGHIGTQGNSGLIGQAYGSQNSGGDWALWPYDPEPYYWADNFKITEIPL